MKNLKHLRFETLEDRIALTTQAVFSEISATAGLNGLQGGSGEFHAGGLTFTDLNKDGYADLYLIGPSSHGNRLYINVDDGSGGRTYVRAVADGGMSYTAGDSSGAVAADYDNDGDLDIYLTNFGNGPHDLDGADNILFKNMWMEDHPSGVGDPLSLRFIDATASTDPTPTDPVGDIQHGLAKAEFHNPDSQFTTNILNHTMAAAWADVNRDGWVDIYVGSWDGTNGNPAESHDGFLGERDTLYLNNGDGTFTDVTMGPAGSTPASTLRLVDDGSFEAATAGGTTSNSEWNLSGAAQYQLAGWASTDQDQGVWFQSFQGSAQNPVDALLTQQITVTQSGDYVLNFDAKVEEFFTAAGMAVTISSNGTGGTDTVDLNLVPNDNNWYSYSLTLAGVTAGDTLTISAAMLDGELNANNPQSVLMDSFMLYSPDSPPTGWEQVGGWEYFDGTYNDPSLPAEFSGHNGLQFADFNNDGWQDLIVATMGGGGVAPNRDMLYLNKGVDAQGNWLGYHMVSYEIGFGGNESSDMGVTVADLDNDGDLDYFSTLLPDAHPIWINNLVDSGSFGFTRTTINNTFSWGANFHDFDNNGRVDLLVGTEVSRPSYLHLQDDNGNMTEQAAAAGLTSTYSTRGVAVADYDRDGWSEAALWSINGASPGIQFYQNNSGTLNPSHHFLTVELEGDPTLPGQFKSTRDAIGARIYVTGDFDGNATVDADETRIEEVLSGHSNASTTSSLALEFGVGQATSVDVRIVWSSGRETILNSVATDQFLAVREEGTGADFDFDGMVSGLDFLAWQVGYGTPAPNAMKSDGDADNDADVDKADLALWETGYGSAPLVGASSALTLESLAPASSAESDESAPDELRSLAADNVILRLATSPDSLANDVKDTDQFFAVMGGERTSETFVESGNQRSASDFDSPSAHVSSSDSESANESTESEYPQLEESFRSLRSTFT